MPPVSGLHSPVAFAHNTQGVLTDQDVDGPFTCLACNGKMVFRHTHKRTRHTRGTTSTFEVRGHFFHTKATGCGETWVHHAAKVLLVQHPDHPFQSRCGTCGHVQPFAALPSGRRVAERPLGSRTVDVAVLSEDDDTVVGAIEVHHTHACDDDRLMDLWNALGNRWWEVLAMDVVACVQQGVPIPVATHMHGLCPVCDRRRTDEMTSTTARLFQTRDAVQSLLDLHRETKRADQLKRLVAMGGEHVLEFGKYRGVSLEALLTEDAAYVAWVAKGGGDVPCIIPSALVLAARSLLKGHCHACGVRVEGPDWKTLCKECWCQRN